MDRLAILEAAALLGASHALPALEMAGMGGTFRVDQPTRFALTGAPMVARLDEAPLLWNASHLLKPDETLTIGGVKSGVYGYLTFAGGVSEPKILNSHATHLTAGIGQSLTSGGQIGLGADRDPIAGLTKLEAGDRTKGGVLRLMAGPQTDLFSSNQIAALQAAVFVRSHIANRQGVRLDHPDLRVQSEAAAGLASDFIMAGDVQLTGDGVPYVLMAECQTMGGYPRIGTVIDADLPKVAQAPANATFQLEFIDAEEADALWQSDARLLADLRSQVAPRVRDPRDIADLLSYQLISGMTRGDDMDR